MRPWGPAGHGNLAFDREGSKDNANLLQRPWRRRAPRARHHRDLLLHGHRPCLRPGACRRRSGRGPGGVLASSPALAEGPQPAAEPDSAEKAGTTEGHAAEAAQFALRASSGAPISITAFDTALTPLDASGGDQLVAQSETQSGPQSSISVDGILADALANRLLSIPGGRQDVARIPDNAEEVQAPALSQTVGAEAASADAGDGTSAFGDDSFDEADALVTDEGIPIISRTFSLGQQATARASYDDPVKKTIQASSMTIQLLVQPTYGATNSVNIVFGRFSGTIGWTSTSSRPEDSDVVTLTVTSFTPHTASTSGNGTDYSYDAVMDRFYQFARVQPSYITAQSTGSECSISNFYNASPGRPCVLKFLGRDILGLDRTPQAFIVTTNGVSVQFGPYRYITFNKNTADAQVRSNGHRGVVCASDNTYTQMPTYTRPGYRHLGWATEPEATVATWRGGVPVLVTFGRNVTLFAVWSKNALSTVTMWKNYGTGNTPFSTLTFWFGRGWYDTDNPTDTTTPLSTLALPTRPGHEFKGFSTTSTATEGSYWKAQDGFPANNDETFGSQEASKAVNLYATWKLLTYTITYDPDGGTMPADVVDNKETYTVNSLSHTLPVPTKTGYAYTGWTVTGNDKDGFDYSQSSTKVLVSFSNGQKGTWGNLSCKANWTANVYDVRFSANGGTGGQGTSLQATYGQAMPTPVAAPQREGYSFLGWWDKADYTAEGAKQYYSASGASLRSYDVDGAITLYAAWGKRVDLTCHANGGALMYSPTCRWEGEGLWFIPSVVRYIVNEDLSLTTIDANGTNRTIRADGDNTGLRLVGWGTGALGPMLPVGEVPTSGNLEIYALWEESGTLYAFANGGAVKYADTCKWSGSQHWTITAVTRCVVGEDGSLATTDANGTPRVIVSDDGARTLLGWGASPEGPILSPGTYALTRETSLYAIWSQVGEVGRYPNGGALMYSSTCRWSGENYVGDHPNDWKLIGVEKYVIRDDAQVEVHTPRDTSMKLRITGADPDGTDRKLLGWSRTATGSRMAAGTYGALGYVGLYAVWDSSTLSFDANGGTGGQFDQVTAIYGEAMPAISTERPVRTGYSFTGWYDVPDADSNPDARKFYSTEGAGAGPWDVGRDMTLYAGWHPNSYKVLLDANGEGAVIGGATALDASVGTEVALPEATRYGYAFRGWALDADGLQPVPDPAVDLATGEDGDEEVTLYARWVLMTDVELPVVAASGVSFELGVPDGAIRVAGADGSVEAEGWLRSKMPVEVTLDAVSCRASEDAGQGEVAAFWAQHGSYADLAIRPDGSPAAEALVLSAGDEAKGDAIPSGFAIPAATSAESLGERKLLYSLSLDRLFAGAEAGGAGVDIVDLLPSQGSGSFALPTRLLDVVFTVDVAKYA